MFVDKEAILPHNNRISTCSDKIGAVGKVSILQALYQKDGKRRKFFKVLRTEDPYTHAYSFGKQPASGNRKRDVKPELHDLSGCCRRTPCRKHVLQQCHAHFTRSGTNSRLSPQHIFISRQFVTEGDRTQLFDRAIGTRFFLVCFSRRRR